MEFRSQVAAPPAIQMAPLIDVVFILLIFFMLTSVFVKPQHIEVMLPNADSSVVMTPEEALEVTLTSESIVYLNQVPVTLEELAQQLQLRFQLNPEQAVVVKSDGGAPVESMIGVLDQIRLSGGVNVSVATKPRM